MRAEGAQVAKSGYQGRQVHTQRRKRTHLEDGNGLRCPMLYHPPRQLQISLQENAIYEDPIQFQRSRKGRNSGVPGVHQRQTLRGNKDGMAKWIDASLHLPDGQTGIDWKKCYEDTADLTRVGKDEGFSSSSRIPVHSAEAQKRIPQLLQTWNREDPELQTFHTDETRCGTNPSAPTTTCRFGKETEDRRSCRQVGHGWDHQAHRLCRMGLPHASQAKVRRYVQNHRGLQGCK